MVKPRDESERARFASELDRNFSVIASAGSGKTTAITKRVLSIARSPNAVKILPCLVIVTFTNRAADEMQQRTRQALLQENLRPDVQTAFNRAFFGTIHSFCMKLLTDFGHFLGLPAPLELVEDDEDLWQEFAQNQTRIGRSLGEKDRGTLLRFVQAGNLMELARRAASAVLHLPGASPCPPLDFAEVYQSVDQAGRDNIGKSQAELREWERRFAGDWEYLRWPVCFTAPNARFTQLWQEKFAPLRKWICEAATCVAAKVQRDYLDFRLDHGLVTYGDQIALAKELAATSGRRAENSRRKLSCHPRRGTGHRAAAIFRAAGSDAPAGSGGTLVARSTFRSAARALLYGRRFPAIDLLAARGPELLPDCSSSADCRQARREPGICSHVSARPEAARFR